MQHLVIFSYFIEIISSCAIVIGGRAGAVSQESAALWLALAPFPSLIGGLSKASPYLQFVSGCGTGKFFFSTSKSSTQKSFLSLFPIICQCLILSKSPLSNFLLVTITDIWVTYFPSVSLPR